MYLRARGAFSLVLVLAALLATHGTAQAQISNIEPVYGPAEAQTVVEPGFIAYARTNFAPTHIQPGDGLTYTEEIDLVAEEHSGDRCDSDPDEGGEDDQSNFWLQPVAPQGNVFDNQAGPLVSLEGATSGWRGCFFDWGQRDTWTYSIPGSATDELDTGCYQVELYSPFPGEASSGTISMLSVGNAECVVDECNDGESNDFDGLIDALDAGCADGDGSEYSTAGCDNGIDDDIDGQTDWPRDPGCADVRDPSEVLDFVTLTSAVDPAEHGALSGCRSICAGQYERGVTLTLAVAPDPGWRFVHWTGACAGFQPTCSVTMDTDKQAGAVLEPATECSNLMDDDFDGAADLGNDGQCTDLLDDDECATLLAPHVRGVRPAWRSGDLLADFPNDDAMCAATWVPQINQRFVPQGLALRSGSALISGYTCRFADSGTGCRKKSNTERCRLMSVQLSTGKVTADRHFSRQQCGHGGGVAVDPQGHIWIADTRELVFLKGIHDDKPKSLVLQKPIKAAFLTQGRSGRILLGEHALAGKPKLRAFTWQTLKQRLGEKRPRLRLEDSVGDATIPHDAQGAAYGPDGLWVARSTSTWGKLATPRRSLGFGPGVEEIEFAADGSLWAVFEAGSKKFPAPKPFLPVIARFDVDALK